MKGKVGIGPSGVISGGGGGSATGGGGGGTGHRPAEDVTRSGRQRRAAGPGGVCTCPECGFEAMRVISKPCRERDCPRCGARMLEAPEAPGVRV
jgi:hypothetical protein